MKTLRESLLDDDLVGKTDEMIKDEIEAFLKENYDYMDGTIKINNKPNKNSKYEVLSTVDVTVKNYNITSLTNGMFIWVKVYGDFTISYCNYLESLEGAPKEVDGDFYCSSCQSLKSLKGAPEKVGRDFYCTNCQSLKSLEGSPKEVGGDFYCSSCQSLKSLKGAPKKVRGEFYCDYNNSLKSLDGAPKEVGRDFYCSNCDGQFTIEDVKKISNVKGKIKC